MKRYLIVCLAIILLFGCGQKVSSDTKKVENDIPEYLVDPFINETPDEFKEYLLNNPIDRAIAAIAEEGYENGSLFTTLEMNAFYSACYDIWENEMNIVYHNLADQLSGDATDILIKSQAAWEVENQNNTALWSEVLDSSKGHGSGDYMLILLQSMDRVRKRTFLLAEYYYWFTGAFEFFSDGGLVKSALP